MKLYDLNELGQYGYYWSSTRSSPTEDHADDYPWAQALTFGQTNSWGIDASSGIVRYRGLNVRAVCGGSSGGSSGGGGSGGETGEAPRIISFDYTATKTSITVKFMATERPSSAKIKYGESTASRSLSTSISGKQISATATGLKSGTKYYFSCTVSNSYGSTDSDGWTAMTNY